LRRVFGEFLPIRFCSGVNNGLGIFSDTGQSLGIGNKQEIALGDLNSDGHPDLVEGIFYGDYANRVYLNNGIGSFIDTGQRLGVDSTRSVTLGDLDNDGDLDFLSGNRDSMNIIYLNDANAQFSPSDIIAGRGDTISIVLGDIDNDHDLDIVEGNYGDGSSSSPNYVYLNNRSASITNGAPSAPTMLSFKKIGESIYRLYWNSSTDDITPQIGLNYIVRVGTTPGGQQIISGITPSCWTHTGATRQVIIRNLQPGTYYWSVRAVDGGCRMSDWATEAYFTIQNP
jgi:hypothetical protein